MSEDEDEDEDTPDGDVTPGKHRGLAEPWKRGQSGNPSGRPKGARSKLSEDFIQALYEDWQLHGKAVIERVRTENPVALIKIIASLIPKQFEVNASPFEDLTDEELDKMIETAAAALGFVRQEKMN
jgi:hypothetical protein